MGNPRVWLGSFFDAEWTGFAIFVGPLAALLVYCFVLIAQGKMDWNGNLK